MNNERTKAEQLVASTWPGIHLEKRLGKSLRESEQTTAPA